MCEWSTFHKRLYFCSSSLLREKAFTFHRNHRWCNFNKIERIMISKYGFEKSNIKFTFQTNVICGRIGKVDHHFQKVMEKEESKSTMLSIYVYSLLLMDLS